MTQLNCLMLIVLVALAALALLSPSITTSIGMTAQAKEIVATNEWQLLSENDTLPAGLHVRIDLTTGEKWAKNSDVDETADKSNDADISVDGSGSSGNSGGAEEVRKKKKSIWNKVKSFFKRGSNKTNSTSKVEMETATVGDGEVVTTLSSTTTTYSAATNAVTNNDKLGVTDDIIRGAAREKREALAARDRHVQSLHAADTTAATNGDNGDGDSSSSSSSAGAVSVIIDNDGSVLSSSSSSSSLKSSNNNNNENDDESSSSTTTTSTTSNDNKKDYEMMHRVMSKLPPEELDRFGGLPQLTLLASTKNTTNGTSRSDELMSNLTLVQREYFERRMEELWSARQEELRMAQDGLADLPGMLKQRIGILVSYLNDTDASLQGMLFQRRNNTLYYAAQEEVNDDINKMELENDTNSVEEQGIVTNVIDALKDLEYLLSDVDMARDFHTLGGWGPLVTLLDVNVHTVVVDMHPVEKEEVDNDTEVETTTTMMILIDEIRTLAAMTIGTAVGNMGEFRFWALEDVNMSVSSSSSTSTSTTTTNAVSLLTTSLQDVLSFQDDDTSPSSLGAQYVARAKYNLRAIYALGALLRGNPIAQQYFVTYNGPELLVLNALYTISSSNSDNDDGRRRQRMVSLDYKFASRVLALGEDVVMDIILHGDEYSERNNQQQWEEEMTASRLVAAFTSESWCTLSLRLLSSLPVEMDITVLQKRSIRTGAMTAVRALAPACRERTNNDKWGLEEVHLVRSEWNREGSDDGLDPVYRRELLVLTDEILEELRA